MQGGILATELESVSAMILTMNCNDLQKELLGRFWSVVADLLSCRVQEDSEEDMPGQAMLASRDGNDSTASQVLLGVANVHVDAVVL